MLAIDVGSGNEKVAYLKENGGDIDLGIVDTIAGRTSKDELEEHYQGTALKTVEFEDEVWIAGMEARSYLPPDRREDTLNDDWNGSRGWLAIIYHTIGSMFPEGGKINLAMATGVPQRLYGKLRPKLMKILDRTHSFKYGDVDYSVTIQPYILPQAHAALLYQASEDPSVLDEPTGLLDFGTHTTGVSVIDGEQFVNWQSGGASVGTGQVARLLDRYLQERFHLKPQAPEKLHALLLKRRFKYRDAEYDLGEAIDGMAEEVSRPIMEEIRRVWGDSAGGDFRVFMAGGGAQVFKSSVERHIEHAEMVENPLYSVVLGLMEFLRSRYED